MSRSTIHRRTRATARALAAVAVLGGLSASLRCALAEPPTTATAGQPATVTADLGPRKSAAPALPPPILVAAKPATEPAKVAPVEASPNRLPGYVALGTSSGGVDVFLARRSPWPPHLVAGRAALLFAHRS